MISWLGNLFYVVWKDSKVQAALASEMKFSWASHMIVNAEALHTLGLCKYASRLFRKN